jgi:anti-sigma regulatory factor (Ser/Thr protein kinase)
MVKTTTRTAPMLTFALLSIPESAGIARRHVRVALERNGLKNCADDAAAVVSELVANAVQHASTEDTAKIWVTLVRINDPAVVAVVMADAVVVIIVTDSSPYPPVKHDPPDGCEHWRGLRIVQALSARWGWLPVGTGKAVFAVLSARITPMTRKEYLR